MTQIADNCTDETDLSLLSSLLEALPINLYEIMVRMARASESNYVSHNLKDITSVHLSITDHDESLMKPAFPANLFFRPFCISNTIWKESSRPLRLELKKLRLKKQQKTSQPKTFLEYLFPYSFRRKFSMPESLSFFISIDDRHQ